LHIAAPKRLNIFRKSQAQVKWLQRSRKLLAVSRTRSQATARK
jgi:hypothetical protein